MCNIQKILLLTLFFVSFPLSADDTYQVGYKKLEINLKETKETFPIALVYPTLSPEKKVKFGPFNLKLAIDSPVASGKFPMVIISHGSGGTNLGHRSIAFALARKGFIIGMPLHPKNNYKNNSAEGTKSNWVNRPKHIKKTIDSIISNSIFVDNVNSSKVAVIGHSAGGYSALAVAGGIANTSHLNDLCKNYAKDNQVFCDIANEIPSDFKFEEIKNIRDERIKAIVLMAPVGVLFKSENSLANVDASLLLIRAEKDQQLIEPHHADVISKNYLDKNKLRYLTIKNAGHYSFITPFPKAIRSRLGKVSIDPEGFDRDAFHRTLSTDISEYLIKALK